MVHEHDWKFRYATTYRDRDGSKYLAAVFGCECGAGCAPKIPESYIFKGLDNAKDLSKA